MTQHLIINGDSRQMKMIQDESVHLAITSPPYWQLKDYGVNDQIGYNDTYENYINHLNLVWNQCHRVLHPGCKLCINIGDQFARSTYYGRYKVIPIRTEIIKFCETIGFDYMGAIIWQKFTSMNTTGGAIIMGSFPYPRNGILKLDYEFILIFKKHGTPPKPTQEQKKRSILTKTEWNTYFSGHWNIVGSKQKSHIAMYPEELPTRLIKMFSFHGETVLDPFLGSGTTTLAARKLERNSVGYEINPEYIPIIKEKLESIPFECSSTPQYLTDSNVYNAEEIINQLPYIFKDPLKIKLRHNPKTHHFGSKIDKHTQKREEYITVKEIISPELIKLRDNTIIRLIGIKENKTTSNEAIQYLNRYVKGKKTYLKPDPKIPDTPRKKCCRYLFLKNETLVNTQLIKRGLVNPDTESDYKYKTKFIKLAAGIEQKNSETI